MRVLFLISRFFTIGCLFLPCVTAAQGTWERKTDCPISRVKAVAFSIGQYGYVGTGVGNDSVMNDFWRYDPVNDSWQQVASMPTLGQWAAFSFVINGIAYVGSGYNPDASFNFELWSYDPVYDKWGRKENIPWMVYADETLASFSIGNRGYLVATHNQNNFREYDPENDTWTNKTNFPTNQLLGMVSFTIGNKGYVGSGFDGQINALTERFWEYDPAADTWTRKADFPKPRGYAVGFSVEKCGYIGLGVGRAEFFNDCWEYRQTTDVWARVADCGFWALDPMAMTMGSKAYVGPGGNLWEFAPDFSDVQLTPQSYPFSMYPNPTSDLLKISTDVPAIRSMTIYNSLGQVVMKGKFDSQTIDVSGLTTGVYRIVCYTDGRVLSATFIKE